MSESLRNDGRVWVPKVAGDNREPHLIPEDERDYYLERLYPSFGNLALVTFRPVRQSGRLTPVKALDRSRTVYSTLVKRSGTRQRHRRRAIRQLVRYVRAHYWGESI